ncbi:MAG: hypothetical protein RL557_168 [archaeon]
MNKNFISAEIHISLYSFLERASISGVVIENTEQRISTLELWKQTITETVDSILNSVEDLIMRLDLAESELDIHESRLDTIENQLSSGDGSIPNYFKYLGSSDRKNIVCGYAQDNRLTHLEDLGWSCNLTYKTSRSGKESVSCKCDKI